VDAIRTGDAAALRDLIEREPDLATARIGDARESRSLLHVVADWPGHFPNGGATVAILAAAGADVNAPFAPHAAEPSETPLHWAASSDDVEVLDALLDAGADIEAPGSSVGGGAPLANACVFGQWRAARRLVERGAHVALWEAATLGLLERVEAAFGPDPVQAPTPGDVDHAFWFACHGGQQRTAASLLVRGADVNWLPPWERLTPLDAAVRSEAPALAQWLRAEGARRASELA
jgi:uncharacterized protein